MPTGINQNFLQEKKYYPLLSDLNSLGQILSVDESTYIWKAFDVLPETTKDFFIAPELQQKIAWLQNNRGFSDTATEVLSAIIREYTIFKRDALWLENTLLKNIDRKDVIFTKEFLQKNIFSIKPRPKTSGQSDNEDTTYKVKTVELPILDALGKYQRLSEHAITDGRIIVKGEPAPVRATIRNWLRCYRDALGIRRHSSMERGQFLFQNENTRRLDSDNREKLSMLLRSLDENTPISIDPERQEIVFSQESTPLQSKTETTESSLQPHAFQKALEWKKVNTQNNSTVETNQFPKLTQRQEEISSQDTDIFSNYTRPKIPIATTSSLKNIQFSSKHVLPHEKEMKETPSLEKQVQNTLSEIAHTNPVVSAVPATSVIPTVPASPTKSVPSEKSDQTNVTPKKFTQVGIIRPRNQTEKTETTIDHIL